MPSLLGGSQYDEEYDPVGASRIMSTFGDRTFKQEVLDFIIDEAKTHNLDLLQAIEGVMDVVSHISLTAFRKDAALARIYERAKEDAKSELMKKMNS
jgi:hypothetical protein